MIYCTHNFTIFSYLPFWELVINSHFPLRSNGHVCQLVLLDFVTFHKMFIFKSLHMCDYLIAGTKFTPKRKKYSTSCVFVFS